jgi:Fic family protein
MSAFYEQHKDEYIDTMFNVSARGEWAEWVELCLRGTIDQCNDSIRRCEALGGLRSAMHERVSDASPRTHQQIEELFSRPVCTVPFIRDRYDVSYPTARADIDRLIAVGILKKISDTTHPTVFMAPEIFEIAYS